MNRRGFFKTLGIGVVGLCGAKVLFGSEEDAEVPTTLAACSHCGAPIEDWPTAMQDEYMLCGQCKSTSGASEPVLFVGGPLHGQVREMRNDCPRHIYRRYGTHPGKCFAIVDGLESVNISVMLAMIGPRPTDPARPSGAIERWRDYWGLVYPRLKYKYRQVGMTTFGIRHKWCVDDYPST